MIPLILAGISLGSTAVSWYNGHRLESVTAEIDRLSTQRQKIVDAEEETRWRLLRPYLEHLAARALEEAAVRAAVLDDLEAALGPAVARLGKPFGDRGPEFYTRIVFELEGETASLRAEHAYFSALSADLDRRIEQERAEVLPPSVLVCPPDFPREGGLVQFESGDASPHGYYVHVETPAESPGKLLALYDVDHETRRARACPVRGALLAAATKEEGAIDAVVTETHYGNLIANFYGVELLLPVGQQDRRLQSLRPGDEVTVYPTPWTLTEILAAPRLHQAHRSASRVLDRDRLNVAVRPRIESRPQFWSPIPIEVDAQRIPEISAAWAAIQKHGLSDSPWTIEADDDLVLFTLGDVTLRLAIDAGAQRFRLAGVDRDHTPSRISVRIAAELNVIVPGNEDGSERLNAPFVEFIEALFDDLQSHRIRTLRRQGAREVKKLSLIYEDQVVAEIEDSSQHLFVTRATPKGDRLELDALLLNSEPAAWLLEALDHRRPRALKVAGGTAECRVTQIAQTEESEGMLRLTVETPDHLGNVDPYAFDRLLNETAGRQQQVLIQALDDLMFDEYESAAVRHALLAPTSAQAPYEVEGSGPVYDALAQSEGLFAVWGPPGTGKTTLIVRLLADAFAAAEREGRPLNVLVSAPTHVAVDEILQRLLDEYPTLRPRAVRYGAEEKVGNTPLADIWHEQICAEAQASVPEAKGDPLVEKWRSLDEQHSGRVATRRWILRGRSIHGATCVGMARRDLALSEQSFDLAIVDEAGKAFLADLLVPARRAKRLILVGDHKQLPPTVTSESLNEQIGYRLDLEEVERILKENAFHRLFDRLPASQKGMLNVQYRMDPTIGDTVSTLFYEGHLQSGRPSNPWPWTEKRLTLVDFSGVKAYKNERVQSGSQRNRLEADVLRHLMRALNERTGEAAFRRPSSSAPMQRSAPWCLVG